MDWGWAAVCVQRAGHIVSPRTRHTQLVIFDNHSFSDLTLLAGDTKGIWPVQN